MKKKNMYRHTIKYKQQIFTVFRARTWETEVTTTVMVCARGLATKVNVSPAAARCRQDVFRSDARGAKRRYFI